MKKKGDVLYLVSLLFLLSFSSCKAKVVDNSIGLKGRDGLSFLSIQWYRDQPKFVDVSNSGLPSNFYWNRFYRIYPGSYQIHYEGRHLDGQIWKDYAWDLEYDIWVEVGENGRYRYDGKDGRDAYFTIECTPMRPYYTYDLKTTGAINGHYGGKINKGDSVIIEKSLGDYRARFVYKRVK